MPCERYQNNGKARKDVKTGKYLEFVDIFDVLFDLLLECADAGAAGWLATVGG